MEVNLYKALKSYLKLNGYKQEIKWAEDIQPCETAEKFFSEYAWVVINSGTKNQIAEKIWEKVREAIQNGVDISNVYGHEGKVKGIKYVWEYKEMLFHSYQVANDKLKFLKGLPWIGDITKYHLAKNLGFDCIKPDRHLERIAKQYDQTPEELCKKISKQTGDPLPLVDTVLWRSANLELI